MAPSCVGNCSFREVMSAIAMSCSETVVHNISPHARALTFFLFFFFFECSLGLEELGVGNTDIDVPVRAEHFTVTSSQNLASCLSLN